MEIFLGMYLFGTLCMICVYIAFRMRINSIWDILTILLGPATILIGIGIIATQNREGQAELYRDLADDIENEEL